MGRSAHTRGLDGPPGPCRQTPAGLTLGLLLRSAPRKAIAMSLMRLIRNPLAVIAVLTAALALGGASAASASTHAAQTELPRGLPADVLSNGSWEVTSEGGRIWRMVISSPGSTGLRVEFVNFAAGNGMVWLHDDTHVAGPYTGRGIYDDGHFWSASFSSASVTIEYEPAPGTPPETAPPFEIHTIAHQAMASLRKYMQRVRCKRLPPVVAILRSCAEAPASNAWERTE